MRERHILREFEVGKSILVKSYDKQKWCKGEIQLRQRKVMYLIEYKMV